MINPKYLSPEIKDKLNCLPLELCEYIYMSKFKKDIVLKWIEIVGQRGDNIDQYLNMIDTLTDLNPSYWRMEMYTKLKGSKLEDNVTPGITLP